MFNSIVTISEDIRNEFVVEKDGKVYAKSIRAVARLAGVSDSSIRNILQNLAAHKVDSEYLLMYAGQDFTGAQTKLPDTLVAAIIKFYASRQNEQAVKVALAFMTVGIRTWFQQQLGYNELPYLPGEEAVYFATKYLESHAENKVLKAKIEEDAPKVSAWEAVLKAGGSFSFNAVAKLFNICKPGDKTPLGQNKLFQLLREERFIFKNGNSNQPYQSFVNQGLFEMVIKQVGNKDNPMNVFVTRFTTKGIEKVFSHLKTLGYEIMENKGIDEETIKEVLAE